MSIMTEQDRNHKIVRYRSAMMGTIGQILEPDMLTMNHVLNINPNTLISRSDYNFIMESISNSDIIYDYFNFDI